MGTKPGAPPRGLNNSDCGALRLWILTKFAGNNRLKQVIAMFKELLVCAAGLGIASLLGSAIGLVVRKIPHRWNDIFLGYCAGMMVAASIVCLIMPAIEMAGASGWWQPVVGVALGVALIAVLDRITPHLHHLAGVEEGAVHEENHGTHNRSIDRVLLFVIAIAIHKFPEGLATGVVFDSPDVSNAYAVAITIALQNIPEGMVVVVPLLVVGVKFARVVCVALTVALLEAVGVIVGYLVGDLSSALLPALMALAGGAMLYVISDEMIPETHSHGYEKPATYALVVGVLTMLYVYLNV